jgi:hypothetical protein
MDDSTREETGDNGGRGSHSCPSGVASDGAPDSPESVPYGASDSLGPSVLNGASPVKGASKSPASEEQSPQPLLPPLELPPLPLLLEMPPLPPLPKPPASKVASLAAASCGPRPPIPLLLSPPLPLLRPAPPSTLLLWVGEPPPSPGASPQDGGIGWGFRQLELELQAFVNAPPNAKSAPSSQALRGMDGVMSPKHGLHS